MYGVQTDSGAHPAPQSNVYRGPSRRAKANGT
jgi:hypothetical protein